MSTKHTPGPWSMDHKFCVTDADGEFVAYLSNAANRRYDDKGMRDREGEANCRLMAAAPELLDALIEARRLLAAEMDWPVADCIGGPFVPINSAISKATGEGA